MARRSRGKTKKNWTEVIRNDMAQWQLTEDMALDTSLGRSKIRVEDGV